ncbi:hypothetical protein [Nitrosarchaeum sp. AC2]|uniref:hypothetical protein n=1 Tax=Nitrosarchaeum sp. AC2 TaxID=2259673 RepID=UPI0015C8D94B|nr:hypothetical protein [Nitrosarchaeum sp. AC2]QLH10893.1 hypothetical protein DSQ20_04980 [Nitrosarchaeum sp. AC2]
MTETKPLISIVNVVASATIDQKLDLVDITKKFPDVEYHPEQFPGLIHRMLDPKTVILIFASGKLVCVGAKLEKDIHRSVHQIHSMLEEKNLMVYS